MGRKTIVVQTKNVNRVIAGPTLPDVDLVLTADIPEMNVPIEYVAKTIGISKASVREMIRSQVFTFGTFRQVNGKCIYYISSKLLYQQRGIRYERE